MQFSIYIYEELALAVGLMHFKTAAPDDNVALKHG
jgi:hypothetical protein